MSAVLRVSLLSAAGNRRFEWHVLVHALASAEILHSRSVTLELTEAIIVLQTVLSPVTRTARLPPSGDRPVSRTFADQPGQTRTRVADPTASLA